MLLEVTPDGYKNMAVSRYPEMTQFLTEIETDSSGSGSITVKFKAFGNADQTKTLQVPLLPDVEKLEPFEVTMHNSPTQAYKMPAKYNDWFTSCFGYEVLFVYLGENRRNVLFEDMVLPPRPTWIRNIAQKYPFLGIPVDEQFQITFADCAPYLIVSKTSLEDVSARLPDGEDMDVTKFRPNIVLEGAGKPWEEDFWGRIKIRDAEIIMQHNCVRCKSINIDYETGKPGTGPSGEVLKKLQKDRRVDMGAKWSPVFGRYSYWNPKSPTQTFKVGDEVNVTKVNDGRTVWSKSHGQRLPVFGPLTSVQPGRGYPKHILGVLGICTSTTESTASDWR